MTDTVDKIIIQSEARGVQQTTNEVQGLSKAMDGVTVASEKTERSSVSLENKFASLERRLGTTAAQARQLEKDQKTINDAVAQNPALASRAADAQAALAARYVNSTKANAEFVKSTGLARHELINLSRQAQDVAVSLGSGQSFGTVLLQQGTQIADVFANSQGSIKGFFSQIVSGAASALTPMRILAGGVLGFGSAAIYISNNWTDAQRQIDQALVGIGRRSGETRQSINKFASDNASAAGLSVSEARTVAIEFAKTGNIAASGLKGVADAVRGYSILTGKDAADATKELAGALSGDLVAAALKVDSVYGVMNAATLENIRALEAQGKRAEAVQIILDRMAPANQKAAESVGFLSKAWTGLTNVLSNVAGGGSLTSDRTPQENVNSLIARRDEFPGTGIARNDRGELQQFKDAGEKAEFFKQKIDEAQAALNAFNAEQAAAQLDKLSTAAFGIGNAILPQIDAIAKLEDAIRKMQEAQAAGVGPSNSSGMISVLEHQKSLQEESLQATIRQAEFVGQLQQAWGGVSAQTATTLQSLRDQLNIAQQITGAGQIRAQQQATVNALLAEGKSIEEASAIAREQRAVAEANATANVEKQTQALRDQNAMIQARQNGTEATTAAAIAYRNAIDSGADATAAAALSAETLKNHILQASSGASQLAQGMRAEAQELASMNAANFANYVRASGDPNMVAGGDTGGYQRSQPGRGGTFSPTPAGYIQYGTSASSRGAGNSIYSNAFGIGMPDQNASFDPSRLYGNIANQASAGGLSASLAAVMARVAPGGPNNTQAFSAQLSQVEQIIQAMNSGASRNEQIANLQNEMSWLQSTPQSLQRDLAIINLRKSIDDLKNSTDALNETNKVTLNPLYNGRDALSIGYYKAAKGLDVVAQGPTTGDQVPFHAMVNGGERITITPAGQPGNDNGKVINQYNTFNIGGSTSNRRRSLRQAAQGFGQMTASLS